MRALRVAAQRAPVRHRAAIRSGILVAGHVLRAAPVALSRYGTKILVLVASTTQTREIDANMVRSTIVGSIDAVARACESRQSHSIRRAGLEGFSVNVEVFRVG